MRQNRQYTVVYLAYHTVVVLLLFIVPYILKYTINILRTYYTIPFDTLLPFASLPAAVPLLSRAPQSSRFGLTQSKKGLGFEGSGYRVYGSGGGEWLTALKT